MSLTNEVLRFENICVRLRRLITIALAIQSSDTVHFESITNFVVIRLQDEWAVRCRAIIVKSANGKIQTRSGRILPRSPVLSRSFSPLDVLRNEWTTKRKMGSAWEPKWFDANDSIRAATKLRLVNESEISLGLGAGTAASNLRIVRNVVVHSLPTTWRQFRQLERDLGLIVTAPSELVVSRDRITGDRYINIWMSELKNNLFAAIQ